MGCSFGESIRVTVFGQSHSPAVGMTLEGLPAGVRIDVERLRAFLARRAPGRDGLSSQRREPDEPEFLSGLQDGVTCGAPLTVILRNLDARPEDYAALRDIPRPGHADYAAWAKYGGARDAAGGGQFSGRLTAPLCAAGGICLQFLEREGVSVSAYAFEIAGEREPSAMEAAIRAAQSEGDSVGGIVACEIDGLPAGVGEPMFGGMENRLAQAIFAIPAVKGIEFGEGFAASRLRGSENNDAFAVENGRVVTTSNHCGGILGGLTTGMPITFRAAFKPTPSIAKTQQSVDLTTMRETEISVIGRHDPCIVPRAVPAVEAAAAIAAYDALITNRKYSEK
jgi:chorismate synthase